MMCKKYGYLAQNRLSSNQIKGPFPLHRAGVHPNSEHSGSSIILSLNFNGDWWSFTLIGLMFQTILPKRVPTN